MKEALAVNLRRIRTERALSMQALARKSGVARATLIGLEAGTANPTLETLMSIAEALGVPSALLLTADSPPLRLVRAGDDEALQEEYGAVRILDQIADVSILGVLEARVFKGRQYTRGDHPDPPGTQAFLFVISGRMLAGPTAAPVEVRAGDYLRFRVDQPYLLRALGGEARFVSAVCSTRPHNLGSLLPRRPRGSQTDRPPRGRK